MMKSTALAVAAALLVTAGAASAQTVGRHAVGGRGMNGDRLFDMADVNHDGQISRAEFRAGMERMRERRMERRAMRMQRGEGGRGQGMRGFGAERREMPGMGLERQGVPRR